MFPGSLDVVNQHLVTTLNDYNIMFYLRYFGVSSPLKRSGMNGAAHRCVRALIGGRRE